MPTIHVGSGWKITMYYRDHLPPHFHVVTRDRREAQVRIDNLAVIVSDVPPRITRDAAKWAIANKATLMAAWNSLHPI